MSPSVSAPPSPPSGRMRMSLPRAAGAGAGMAALLAVGGPPAPGGGAMAPRRVPHEPQKTNSHGTGRLQLGQVRTGPEVCPPASGPGTACASGGAAGAAAGSDDGEGAATGDAARGDACAA